jgi:hypothetical protein
MNIAEWRASRQITKDLPSGLTTDLRRVSLLDLIGQGKIPNTLFGMISNLDKGEVEITPELIAEITPMLNVLVKATMVNPPVADASDADHIGLDEMEFVDKLFIFQWANAAIKGVAPFLQQPAGDVAATPGVQDVSNPSQ